jgi:hypothetical protein
MQTALYEWTPRSSPGLSAPDGDGTSSVNSHPEPVHMGQTQRMVGTATSTISTSRGRPIRQ